MSKPDAIRPFAERVAQSIAVMIEAALPPLPENTAYNIPQEQCVALLIAFAEEIKREAVEP